MYLYCPLSGCYCRPSSVLYTQLLCTQLSYALGQRMYSAAICQAHSSMHTGHPCPGMYPSNDYFRDGITNGAAWYNVAGECPRPLVTDYRCGTVLRFSSISPAFSHDLNGIVIHFPLSTAYPVYSSANTRLFCS